MSRNEAVLSVLEAQYLDIDSCLECEEGCPDCGYEECRCDDGDSWEDAVREERERFGDD